MKRFADLGGFDKVMNHNDPAASLLAGDAYVCACLRVTEPELIRAIACQNIRTLKDLRVKTGAGDGCTACHRRLRCYLASAAVDAVA